jgi:hypothetical protein
MCVSMLVRNQARTDCWISSFVATSFLDMSPSIARHWVEHVMIAVPVAGFPDGTYSSPTKSPVPQGPTPLSLKRNSVWPSAM